MRTRPRTQRNEPLDWTALRARLDQARSAMADAAALSPERIQALLDERTRALARVPEAAEQEGDAIEVLCFALGSERYAIETKYVREVVPLAELARVPGIPDFILGITNLRGEVFCVVDLCSLLGIPRRGVTDLSRVLVLGGQRTEFGVLADRADEVVRLPKSHLVSPPSTVAGTAGEHLHGVTRDALVVLDGAALLGDPRLVIEQNEPGAARQET